MGFLFQFLSAVMLKDYETALKYCKLSKYREEESRCLISFSFSFAVLQYEPNNATAKEFYPLILEKLNQSKDFT